MAPSVWLVQEQMGSPAVPEGVAPAFTHVHTWIRTQTHTGCVAHDTSPSTPGEATRATLVAGDPGVRERRDHAGLGSCLGQSLNPGSLFVPSRVSGSGTDGCPHGDLDGQTPAQCARLRRHKSPLYWGNLKPWRKSRQDTQH